MLTGELRNQIDRIWDSFWSGGIANPIEVIEFRCLLNVHDRFRDPIVAACLPRITPLRLSL